MKEILKLNNLYKDYGIRGFKTKVLNDISLTVGEGEFISIMGPSGAGKTTLLNLLSTLDKPTKGEILLDGVDITKLNNKELSNSCCIGVFSGVLLSKFFQMVVFYIAGFSVNVKFNVTTNSIISTFLVFIIIFILT